VDKIGHSQNFGHRHISSFSVNSVCSVRDKDFKALSLARSLRSLEATEIAERGLFLA